MAGKAPNLPCIVKLRRIGVKALDYDNLVYSLKQARDTTASFLIPGKAPGQADGSAEITWIYEQEKRDYYGIQIEISPKEESI